MKHIRVMGRQRPALAQFESMIQLVSLLDSVLRLIGNFQDTFPEKNPT